MRVVLYTWTLQFTTGHVRVFSIVSLSTTYLPGLMLVRDSMSRCTSDSTLTITCYTQLVCNKTTLVHIHTTHVALVVLIPFLGGECPTSSLESGRSLRWGWVFLQRTWILSRIQFTRHFIEFVFVETQQFVGSNVYVILTRQTCGQRSSMSAGSKR